MKRRDFISRSAILGGAVILPWRPAFATSNVSKKLRIGLIADLHQDVMHDGEKRLEAFLTQAAVKKSDFVIQMGDFCVPKDENDALMKLWKTFKKPSYHILGNHDTDGGYTKSQTMDFWGMKERYYSFDAHGYHFIILDGNDTNPEPWNGYHRYIGKEQQNWLRKDLELTQLNTFVFSHQSLENEDGGVANFNELRAILEEANQQAGEAKVVACFSGHHHTDYMTAINDIYYVQINSASYHWVGNDYKHVRYSKDIDERYPWIKYTIPYKDPLYTFMDIDPAGTLKIAPKSTTFVGAGPEELGMPERPVNNPIVAQISDFKFTFNN